MPVRLLSADWVVPMDGPPIHDGAVLIGADGRIREVGPRAAVAAPHGVERERFPGAALIPGLVNTHTHLELTGLAGKAPEDDFPSWIRRVRALKAERSQADFLDAARAGLAACHAAGVTTVADTGDSGAVIEAMAGAGGSGIAYHEVFGPHPDQVDESMAGFRARMASLRQFAFARVRLGVSPHAPYTVSGPLYAAIAVFAADGGFPIAVHLAESTAESELLQGAAGPFAEAWAARGIPVPSLPGRSPVEWLAQHGVLGPSTLAIHVVQAGARDIALLGLHRCAVAHCPLSNRRHGHGTAPIGAFLRAGLRVGVGTDSEVSVGALDLLAEARAARALAGLAADAALALATTGAAAALGLEREVGSLRAGMWGDAAVVGIAGARAADAVLEAILASGPADVVETILGGRTVHRR
ncbi:MAG TPA: amidohydrolase family protein [Gemmatimonadales bacterium]|nr:amidohydrolase family protein [Gemmatimonadales bacterium]